MDYEYKFYQEQTIPDINYYGEDGWRVRGFWENKNTKDTYDVLYERSPGDRELIETENATGSQEFYVDKTITYGDSLVISFLGFFLLFLITKTIYKAVFRDD